MPKVSVIVPLYNAAETLERCVRSVVAQTHDDWELILSDDGSSDDSLPLARRLQAELGDRIVVLTGANGGPAVARNRALEVVTGDWVTFLDADDEYVPARLVRMLAAGEPGVDVVTCRHTIVGTDATVRVRGHRAALASGVEAAREVLIETATPYLWDRMFRRGVLESLQFPELRRAEDKVYVLAALARADRVAYLDEPLYRYFVSPTSLTWARVSSLAETRALNAAVAEAVAPIPALGAAVRVSATSAWLNVAHQAMAAQAPEVAARHARACAREISWSDVGAALRLRPVFAVAAAVLKLAPGGYARLYGSYVRRRYGISG